MEKMRMCPRCERKTLHDEWKDSPLGSRANAAERLFFGVISFGASELIMDKYRQCLRCGFRRKV